MDSIDGLGRPQRPVVDMDAYFSNSARSLKVRVSNGISDRSVRESTLALGADLRRSESDTMGLAVATCVRRPRSPLNFDSASHLTGSNLSVPKPGASAGSSVPLSSPSWLWGQNQFISTSKKRN